MNNQAFAEQLVNKICRNDLDIYDKSGFNRLRAISTDGGIAIRTWNREKFIGDISVDSAVAGIVDRIERGMSEQSDYTTV